MSSHNHDDGEKNSRRGYSKNMIQVALCILVMGVSLAIVAALWAWFGHVGPGFSSTVLEQQQSRLRDQYSLPPAPKLSAKQLEVPPSLRNVTGKGTEICSNPAYEETPLGRLRCETSQGNALIAGASNNNDTNTTTAGDKRPM